MREGQRVKSRNRLFIDLCFTNETKEKTDKIDLLRLLPRNNSGIILMVVLWLLVILTTLAIGLGKRTSIDLTLTKHAIGKLKANYIAWGGITYAASQIKADTEDNNTNKFDTLYQLAVKLDENQGPEDVFKGIALGEGYFTIDYVYEDTFNQERVVGYGFRDEESKVNINAMSLRNYKILSNLITLLGYDEETALVITFSVIDWKDSNNNVSHSSHGTEDDYYMGQAKPYHCKNLPFDSLEELLLIRGVTPEIFNKIKDYTTVFPKTATRLSINGNTAPEIVLRALGRSVAGSATNTEISDADSMAEKIVIFRKGPDGVKLTADDRKVEFNEIAFNAKEKTIYNSSRRKITDKSHYIRIHVKGIDEVSEAQTDINAIIHRDDLSVVYWNKN